MSLRACLSKSVWSDVVEVFVPVENDPNERLKMSEENRKEQNSMTRRSSIILPLGMRAGNTDEIMIVDFLDPDVSGQIVCSVGVTKEVAISLRKAINRFLDDE